MKFIITGISLSLMLTACGGPLKNNPNNIDGTYFYSEQKGHTDISKNDDGTETSTDVVDGDVYGIVVIKDGAMDIYELDPQDGTYRVQESSVKKEAGQIHAKLKNYSCVAADETNSTSAGDEFNVQMGDMLKLDANQAKQSMDKILKEYSLIKETDCNSPRIHTLSAASTKERTKSKLQDFLEN